MIATCDSGTVQASATAAATTARSRLGQSGVSVRAINQTAWATTATAASFRPWTQPAAGEVRPYGEQAERRQGDGRRQGEPDPRGDPPAIPARRVPIAIPSWLLAGPGIDWQRVTRSAKAVSSSHPRRVTYSRRK